MDSVPLVVFTGQVPTSMIGGDAFQETDIIGVTRSITKHSFQVRRTADLAATIKAAYHIARTGRPGPVVVDLPKDVLGGRAPYRYPSSVRIPGYEVPGAPDPARLAEAAALMAAAERPLLYVGGGVITAGATEELTALARRTGIPVTTTLHGLGAFPEADPLALGMLGMHGTYCANRAVQACDLLIAVGARFDDRVTGKLDAWAPHARIIHIDIDPSSLSKHIPAECAVLGDAREALAGLLERAQPVDTAAWRAQLDAWRAECPLDLPADGRLHAQGVIRRLGERTGGDAVVVTDVGQHQMWAAQFFRYARTRSHLTSGGLGTMGFSLPAAMGAAFGLAGQDVPVISISGDGGFAMNAQELGVLRQYGLPVKILVINNGKLGMVGQLQELFHEKRYSQIDLTPSNPDFVRLAEAFGVPGLRATTPAELETALDAAWAITDGPVLVECVVEPEELVFPMVPAGASSSDMITARYHEE
jgi:acetolactate synthase-1/2/3 large subunit